MSTAKVVGEAADLADEVGWEELTLAAVADRVGVRLPSLYRHVAGGAELRRLLTLEAKRELAAVLAEALEGRSGRAALVAFGHALRRWALDHPGRFAATRRAPAVDEDPEEVAVSLATSEVLFGALDGYGLTGDLRVDATRAVRSALDGFATIEAAGGFALERSVDASFDWLLDALDAQLRAAGGR